MRGITMSLFRSITAVVTLVGAAALGAPLAAQGGPAPQRITLDDAIGIALKGNVAVRQAQNTVDLSETAVQQQKQQLLPDLRLSLSGSEAIGRSFNQTEGTIVDQQSQALSSGLSSSLTLFDG